MATAERHVPHLKRDFAALRKDFPALQQLVHGKPLAYLDNAASGQTPQSVQDVVAEQQRLHHSNVHRGVHQLSERSTAAYEGAREKIRGFINASSVAEVVSIACLPAESPVTARAWPHGIDTAQSSGGPGAA